MRAAVLTPASASAHVPVNCVDDPDPDNPCVQGTDNGGTSRTFLTDADVTFLGQLTIVVTYDPRQWDTIDDFYNAIRDYWNLNAPDGASCVFFDPDCELEPRDHITTTGQWRFIVYDRTLL